MGLIPLYLGIQVALYGEEEEEEEEVVEKISSGGSSRLFWTVTLITVASGADNLGIYILLENGTIQTLFSMLS